MRLAVDVMGGDHAPEAILKGCVGALPLLAPEDRLVLVGPEPLIREMLLEWGIDDPRLLFAHASDVIGMHEPPALAVRGRPESSIVKMSLLGSSKVEEPCEVVLSAGNTGACVTAAIMNMKRLPGVHRPGIAVTIPAFHGPIVLCDAGANPEPKATHLWQYGIMADTLAKQVLKIESPRVALMNIGSEEAKGSDLVKEARDLLRNTPDLNYIGYVEGRDFFAGAADVIITDGFVGNTILKMAEGMAKSLFEAIASEIFSADPELALKFEPIVKQIYAKNDYHEFGGAPLLGVNGAMMIAHGSSQPRTITAAIRNSKAFIQTRVNEAIVARIAEVESRMGKVTERA
ncbi:MAG: phosphate acyltransferase PlsX [Phycisphaeraceae bacterium]|nr:phosphate acyltransferase PlsX [Phycisphaeraceae bacterium]MCW5763975.1 phosphate acyltransferase PlsX [Phycisphaeraceae bacterium]